jgi:MerR family transcriptional regulator, thiopeptide resistance regulator
LAVQAIAKAEQVIESNGEPDWQAFQQIIEVINMQNDMQWAKRYYSEDARKELDERIKNWTPELQAKAEQDWATLIKDVESAIANNETPSSDTAQALAKRWFELIAEFTKGNRAVSEGLNKLYADQANWPSTFQKPYSDEVGEFICKAQAIREGEAQS